MDCSPPNSVHGILEARILEWVAILFSGGLPDPGVEPRSPTLQADSLPSEPSGSPQEIILLMDMNLGKLGEMVGTGEAWSAVVHGVTKSQTGLGN